MTTQTADSKTLVTKTLASIGEIATLPEITVKIIEVVEDPKGTAKDLHEVIKRDPALASKVLKVVNSAFYGLPGQVANVDRAIVLLGLSAVKNIAIAASISRMFKGSRDADGFSARDLWRHSVAVGVAAKKLSQASGDVAGHDEMFLAGLIHDLGLLLERQAFPDKLAEVVRRCAAGEGHFLDLERDIIGATHQDFGEGLTTKWKFPRHLRAAVGFHHSPETLATELQRVGMLIHCADILCCQEELGFSLTAKDTDFTEELLDTLHLTVEQLVEVRDNMVPELEEAEAMLGAGV